MLDEEALRGAGYKPYPEAAKSPFKHADNLWQKCFAYPDDGQKAYFVNIWQYKGLYEDRDGWQPEAQLYLDADHSRHVNLTLGGFETVEEIEKFVARAYDELDCAPYEQVEQV